MSVLIVTNFARDAHLMPVARELLRRGVKVYAFNPGDFPESAAISTESCGAGQRTVLSWNGETLDLSTIRSVWYRRPERFELPEGLLPDEATWLRGECANFVDAIWANTGARWVSDPHHLRRAGLKLVQLKLAEELGFTVPPYMVTNDPQRARAFIDANVDGVVVKTLSTPAITITDKGAGMVYTHRLTQDDLNYLDSVRHGPTQFQAFVRKQRDIRVTVIGDVVFAVAMESKAIAGAEDDFRQVEIWDIPHVPISLPEGVERACLELIRRLGLRFGAIDLLETPEGELVFLEINPNGQWLWLEEMTGLPMAAAMADLLEAGLDGRATRPAPRAPRKPVTIPLDVQTVSLATSAPVDDLSACDAGSLGLAATRAWLQQKGERLFLHVGDVDAND